MPLGHASGAVDASRRSFPRSSVPCGLLAVLLLLVGTVSPALAGVVPSLYAVDPFNPGIHEISPVDGSSLSLAPITLDTAETVQGGNGLAQHPSTGVIYVLLKVAGNSSRDLATIDPATGNAVFIGDTGDRFAGITFGSDGTLYGVTGDGAAMPEALYTLDTADGSPTFVMNLGNGNDGEAIAFNPEDGLIYHYSGLGDRVFESVDPVSMVVTPIPESGDINANEVLGMVYAGGGTFLVGDRLLDFYSVTTAGVLTQTGIGLASYLRGYAWNNEPPTADAGEPPYAATVGTPIQFDGSGSMDADGTIVAYEWDFGDGNTATGATPSHAYASVGTFTVTLTVRDDLGGVGTATVPALSDEVGPALYAVNRDSNVNGLHRIARIDGSTMWSTGISLDVGGVAGGNGMAQDPTTGVMYALLKSGGSRVLATIDPTTGSAVLVGDTGANFAGLTFASDGTLYGVTGDGEATLEPESLYTLSLADASPTFVMTLGNGGCGEAIAYNPDDGQIYHFSGALDCDGVIFERVNPITQIIQAIPLSGYGLNEVSGLVYAGAGTFRAVSINDDYMLVSTGGFVEQVGSVCAGGETCDVLRGLAHDNQLPVCDAGGPYDTMPLHFVEFDGTGSTDADGTIVSYAWDLGDGSTSTDASFNHAYVDPGEYTVTLTVRDDLGGVSTCETTVTVLDVPVAALYGITPRFFGNEVVRINPLDGAILSQATLVLDAGGTAEGGTGLATDPTTGQMYALLRIQENSAERVLATIDPTTGACTFVGGTGDNFAGITFATDGTLYAVSGDGASTPEALFTLNKATGVATFLMNLGNGNDGEAIAYNPEDDLIYHYSGLGDRVFESVDPVSMIVTPIPESGDPVSNEILGMVYAGNGSFRTVSRVGVSPNFTPDYYAITANGVVSRLGVDDVPYVRGFAFANTPPVCDAGGPYATSLGNGIVFDASASSDPDGSIAQYRWDFGDGTTGTGATAGHMYMADGSYMVTLTVIDNLGGSSTCTVQADVSAGAPPLPLYSIRTNLALVDVISRTDGSTISSQPITLDTSETVQGGTGLATDPTTGQMYALLTVQGYFGRILTRIDPVAGSAEFIGDTGDRFAGLAFWPDGTLYAVTGDGATTPSSLYTLDTSTGTATFVMSFGNGDDGEAITYNPDDGFLYHFSGYLGAVMERVDPIGMTITDIPLSGAEVNEVKGVIYDGGGRFLASTHGQEFIEITTAGVASVLGNNVDNSRQRGFAVPGCLQPSASLNVELLGWARLGDTVCPTGALANEVWGYVSPSGREYAILGLEVGTEFYEVTDPTNPTLVGYVPDETSIWSDMDTYGEYCLAVNESEAPGDGLQVIDLSDIDSGNVTLATSFQGDGFSAAHNVFVNEASGYAYLCAPDFNPEIPEYGNDLAIFDVSDPLNPVITATWSPPDPSTRRVHDIHVVTYDAGPYAGREIAFCCTEGDGLYILDVTNKNAIQILSLSTYANLAYTHQCWPSDDLRYLFVGDELDEFFGLVPTTRTLVFDILDLSAPVLVNEFGNGLSAIDHNLMVSGHLLFEANYSTGLRVFDISNVNSITEVAWFDTHPEDDVADYDGAWGIYSKLPSGNILVGDRNRGLFVFGLNSVVDVPGEDDGGDVASAPAAARLLPNRPNPFNPRTTIGYELPSAGPVTLRIFDVGGREVKTLLDAAAHDAGRYSVIWDGRDASGRSVSSGVYFYQLESGDYRGMRRMVLLK